MQDLNIDPNVAEKIKKLLALSRDKAASQGEIENASAAVQRILMQYNLDLISFESHQMKKDLKVMEKRFSLNDYQTRHEAKWAQHLFGGLAKHNMCHAIVSIGGSFDKYDQGEIIIIGQAHNIEIVYYLFHQVIAKIDMMSREYWRVYRGAEKRNTWRRGFLLGAVQGVLSKMAEQERTIMEQDPEDNKMGDMHFNNPNNVNMGALIKINKDAVAEYIQNTYTGLKKSAPTKVSSRDGRTTGFEAGRNIALNKGMGGNKPKGYLN